MTLASLIVLVLKTSIFLTVLSFSLNATLQDATYLFRRPAKLARAVVSMNIVMPMFAVSIVLLFDLHQAVRIALVALSVSPVPPFLPTKALKSGGRSCYTIGLLAAAAMLAIVFIPLTLMLLERVFGVPLEMPV